MTAVWIAIGILSLFVLHLYFRVSGIIRVLRRLANELDQVEALENRWGGFNV